MEGRPYAPRRLSLRRVLALIGLELLPRRIGVARSDAEPDASAARDETAADPHGGEDQRQLLGLALSGAAADLDELRHAVRHMFAVAPSTLDWAIVEMGSMPGDVCTRRRLPCPAPSRLRLFGGVNSQPSWVCACSSRACTAVARGLRGSSVPAGYHAQSTLPPRLAACAVQPAIMSSGRGRATVAKRRRSGASP